MTSTYHPKPNDGGVPVKLHKPSVPPALDAWLSSDQVASIVPEGPTPEGINGLPFAGWTDTPRTKEEWNLVPGQLSVKEPAFCPPKGKMEAAGVVIEEPDGRIWLVSPSNGYGGYAFTFPKGRVEKGVNSQATAIREAYEESGLRVEITGFFADSDRSQSYTRYYTARRVGGSPSAMGWETQAVHLIPREKLAEFLTHKNDLPLLKAILARSRTLSATQDIVKHHGGNLVRMRQAILSFRQQYGHWPSTLALGSETITSVQEHLTPLGYEKLASCLAVVDLLPELSTAMM